MTNYHNGLHHQSTISWTIRLYLCNSRQKHERSHIYSMHKNYRHRRNGRSLHEKCIEMIWTTKENHIRQRTTVCHKIHQRTLEKARNNHCIIHSIPSRDRWRNGKSQSRTRTISLCLLQLRTNQLARTLTIYRIHTQHTRIFSHTPVAISTSIRV